MTRRGAGLVRAKAWLVTGPLGRGLDRPRAWLVTGPLGRGLSFAIDFAVAVRRGLLRRS